MADRAKLQNIIEGVRAVLDAVEASADEDALTFDGFSETNARRCREGFNHELGDWSASDWMTALVGEVGEAANCIKKLNRFRDRVPGNEGSVTPDDLYKQLRGELADAFIYLDLLVSSIGWQLSEIVRDKFNATNAKIHSTRFDI